MFVYFYCLSLFGQWLLDFMDIICMMASGLLYEEYCVLSVYTWNYRDFDDSFVRVVRFYICYSAESCSD